MYNESDSHNGCESCGICVITYYKENYGFYCDECLEEAKENEYRSKQDLTRSEIDKLVENQRQYLINNLERLKREIWQCEELLEDVENGEYKKRLEEERELEINEMHSNI